MKKNRRLILLLLFLAFALLITSCSAGGLFPVLEPSTGNRDDSQDIDDKTGEQNDDPGEDPQEKEDKTNLVYISAGKLNVRQEASVSSPIITALMKGTAVKILEEKTDESSAVWYLISADTASDQALGWIAGEYTVADRFDLLDETLRTLDFSPQEKVKEYPDNPRVKVKGIYLTIYSASGSRVDRLIDMASRTGINTFVIDVKDDKGYMLFRTEAAEKYSPEANDKATVKDIGTLMKKLKDNDIYAIARIVTFKDPTYIAHNPDKAIVYKDSGKPFTNSDGLIWASPYDRRLWEYDVAVAKEAAEAGFNEIQFDYVRFPASDGGKLDSLLDYRNTTGHSKPRTIQDFLKYAYKELSAKNVYVSADIYGLVGSVADDMALGQYWEAISNVVDYVSPMMYPSHYANGTYGLLVPDAYPYETVYNSARDSVGRNKNIETPAIIRPWIQDFTAPWVKGHIEYGPEQVKAQIRALEENGIDEFMLWNASNRYSEQAVR